MTRTIESLAGKDGRLGMPAGFNAGHTYIVTAIDVGDPKEWRLATAEDRKHDKPDCAEWYNDNVQGWKPACSVDGSWTPGATYRVPASWKPEPEIVFPVWVAQGASVWRFDDAATAISYSADGKTNPVYGSVGMLATWLTHPDLHQITEEEALRLIMPKCVDCGRDTTLICCATGWYVGCDSCQTHTHGCEKSDRLAAIEAYRRLGGAK